MGNILLPSDGITIRQGIYEQSSTQKTELGRFIDFEDGRRFRYCKAGTSDLVIALMTMAPAITGNHKDIVQTNYGLSIGDKDNISVLLDDAPSVNEYADGFLCCNKGTGLGQLYRIRKNSATYSPCKIWLYDPIITAIPAASEITLTPNKYNGVLEAAATAAGSHTGVPLIGVTGGYYFWAQTRGYCPFTGDSTITVAYVIGEPVGDAVTMDNAGCMDGIESFTDAYYGICVQIPEVNETGIVDLKLE